MQSIQTDQETERDHDQETAIKLVEGIHSLVKIRPFAKTDESFVYSTWLHGLYYGNEYYSLVLRDTFYRSYHKILDHVFSMKHISMQVACLKEDEDVILGYAVYSERCIHWIYVKASYRKMGLAKRLVSESDFIECSHLTKLGLRIKPKTWKYNPFFMEENTNDGHRSSQGTKTHFR